MVNDIGADLTSVEDRVHTLEQDVSIARMPMPVVALNPATGLGQVRDPLTFDTGWVTHTKINIGQSNPALANFPSATWVHYTGGATEYGPAQVCRIGNMGFLTGLVVRSGAIVNAGATGGRMFMLPTGWRPPFRVMLPCIMNGTSAAGTPAIGQIEVAPDKGSAAGGVYFGIGQTALTAGNGWLALQGAFPCFDVP